VKLKAQPTKKLSKKKRREGVKRKVLQNYSCLKKGDYLRTSQLVQKERDEEDVAHFKAQNFFKKGPSDWPPNNPGLGRPLVESFGVRSPRGGGERKGWDKQSAGARSF